MNKKTINKYNINRIKLSVKKNNNHTSFGKNALFAKSVSGIDNIVFLGAFGSETNISSISPKIVPKSDEIIMDLFNVNSYIDKSVIHNQQICSPNSDITISLSQSNCWKAENTNSRCVLPSGFMSNSVLEGKIRVCKQFNNAGHGCFLFGAFTSWSDADLFYNTTAMDTVGTINWAVGGVTVGVGGAGDLLGNFLNNLEFYIFELGYGGVGYYPYIKIFDMNNNLLKHVIATSPQTRVVNRAGFNWNTAYGLNAYADTSCSLWIESWIDGVLSYKIMANMGAGTLFYDIVNNKSCTTYNTTEAGMWQKCNQVHHNFMKGCTKLIKSGSNPIYMPYNDNSEKIVTIIPSGYSISGDSYGFEKTKKWNVNSETVLKVNRNDDLSTILEISNMIAPYTNVNGKYFKQINLLNGKQYFIKLDKSCKINYNIKNNKWRIDNGVQFWDSDYVTDTSSPLGHTIFDDTNLSGQSPIVERYCIVSGAANTSLNGIYDYYLDINNHPAYVKRDDSTKVIKYVNDFVDGDSFKIRSIFNKFRNKLMRYDTIVNGYPAYTNYNVAIMNYDDIVQCFYDGIKWVAGYNASFGTGFVCLIYSNDAVSNPNLISNWKRFDNNEPVLATVDLFRDRIYMTGDSIVALNGFYDHHWNHYNKSYWFNGNFTNYTRFIDYYASGTSWKLGTSGGSIARAGSGGDKQHPWEVNDWNGGGNVGKLTPRSTYLQNGYFALKSSDDVTTYSKSLSYTDKVSGYVSEPYNVISWSLSGLSIEPGRYIPRDTIKISGLSGNNSKYNGIYFRYNNYYINKRMRSYLMKSTTNTWSLFDESGNLLSIANGNGYDDPYNINYTYTNNVVVSLGYTGDEKKYSIIVSGADGSSVSLNGEYIVVGTHNSNPLYKKIGYVYPDESMWNNNNEYGWFLGYYYTYTHFWEEVSGSKYPYTAVAYSPTVFGSGNIVLDVSINNNDLYTSDLASIFYNTDMSSIPLVPANFTNKMIEGLMFVNNSEPNLYVGNITVFDRLQKNIAGVKMHSFCDNYYSISTDVDGNELFTLIGLPRLS